MIKKKKKMGMSSEWERENIRKWEFLSLVKRVATLRN